MPFELLAGAPVHADAACPQHPDRRAEDTCRRCGTFVCAGCTTVVSGTPFCAACAEHPEVGYLEATRRRFWKKRDAWVWLLGVVLGLTTVSTLPEQLSSEYFWQQVLGVAQVAACLGYTLLKPWSRAAMVVLGVATVVATAPYIYPFPALQGYPDEIIATAKAMMVLVFAATIAFPLLAYFSPRNKLAFGLEVSERELQRVHDASVGNPSARWAVLSGLVLLPVPLGFVPTLWLGRSALRRARASVWPPIENTGLAWLGLALGLANAALWVGVVVFAFVRS